MLRFWETRFTQIKPMKRGGSIPRTWPTERSHGNTLPSLRCARTSRPVPMIRGSPVVMAVAADGSIWVTDDRSRAILRIARP